MVAHVLVILANISEIKLLDQGGILMSLSDVLLFMLHLQH